FIIIFFCVTYSINMIFLKELKMCLRELAIVDDTLEALGTPNEYQRLRNWTIRIIIGWIAYVFFQLAFWNICIFFVYNYDINFTQFSVTTYDTFRCYYPSSVIILSTLISAAILGYTSSRLHRVNDLLHVLYSDLSGNSADYRRQNRSIYLHRRITGAKDHIQYIWIIM
ncbi:hypothetical protein ALC57_09928, partial [Trachymyrmex cornetzi]